MPTERRHRHDTPGRSTPAPSPPERVLDRRAARAVDRAAEDEYGMPGIVLMENAARAVAAQALDLLGGPAAAAGRPVLIVCGGGNNGGDGWAAARHLANAGAAVTVVTLGAPDPASDAGVNRAICAAMEIPTLDFADVDDAPADLIVDAIFGTGLARAVEGKAADAIAWINGRACPVLAVDIPSGLDCDTGRPCGAAVRATRTLSFVGLKPGFLELDAQPFVGTVVIGDIGVPRALVERFGRALPARAPEAREERMQEKEEAKGRRA